MWFQSWWCIQKKIWKFVQLGCFVEIWPVRDLHTFQIETPCSFLDSCFVLLDALWISIWIGRFGADMSISGGHAHLWTPAETISLKGVGNFEEGLEGDWRPLEERPLWSEGYYNWYSFFSMREKKKTFMNRTHASKLQENPQQWKDLYIFGWM